MRAMRLAIAALVLSVAVTDAAVQRDRQAAPQRSDLSYDGQFTFVRLRWQSDFGGFGRRGGFSSAWNHDYPRAEQHLARILKSLTALDIRMDGSLILALDDPELFKYPIAFMWEPGFWNLTDREAESFRAYLLKGGFAVFEDFDGAQQWSVFEAQMRRVLPDARFVKLDSSHRIFNSFFNIKDIDSIVHPMTGLHPNYFGIFEDNDPSKRLIAIANVNGDLSEYWEFSDTGFAPVDLNNEAYKYGINYVIYGLTH
jgi:hypothetical protein